MSLLSLLLLALSSIATTTKVITVSRSNMVSTDPRTAAHQRRADFESRNATAFKKSSRVMSGLTTEAYSKTESVTSPEFPSEDPTEIELTKWLEAWPLVAPDELFKHGCQDSAHTAQPARAATSQSRYSQMGVSTSSSI